MTANPIKKVSYIPGFRHVYDKSEGVFGDFEFVTKSRYTLGDRIDSEQIPTRKLSETEQADAAKTPIMYVTQEGERQRYWLVNPFNGSDRLPKHLASLEHYIFTAADFDKLREAGLITPVITEAHKCEIGLFFGHFAMIQLGLQTLSAEFSGFNVLIGMASAIGFSMAYYFSARKAFKLTYLREPNEDEERGLRLKSFQLCAEMAISTLAFEALPLTFAIVYHTVLPALHLVPQAHAIFFGMMIGTALLMGITGALTLYCSERNAKVKPRFQDYLFTFGKHFLVGFLLAAATLFPAFLGVATPTAFGFDIINAGSYWFSIGFGSLLFSGTLGAVLKKRTPDLNIFDDDKSAGNVLFDDLSKKAGFWRLPKPAKPPKKVPEDRALDEAALLVL